MPRLALEWRLDPDPHQNHAMSRLPFPLSLRQLLIGGLLISIVLRSGEYFVAIPAIPLMP